MNTPIPPPQPTPRLRLPDWPLPPYRFVPGLNPHPFRHPLGHSYTNGDAPTPTEYSSTTPWHQDRPYLRGLDLFDHRYVWESHELWEGIWHQVPKDHSYALLLQALIQAAAFCLKIHGGQQKSAANLLERVSLRCQTLVEREGAQYRGLNLPILVTRLTAFQAEGTWPTLHNLDSSGRITPHGI